MSTSKRILTVIALSFLVVPSFAQNGRYDANRALDMLRGTVETVQKNYYDPNLHGVDMNSRLKTAEGNIGKADSFSVAFGNIAWVLDSLNDSHTFFIPPQRPFHAENGWVVTPVGSKCFITAVKPGSDAAAQGLKPGDELIQWNGFQVTPDTLWKLKYSFNVLAPHAIHDLTVVGADGQPRRLNAKVENVKTQRIDINFQAPDWEDNADLNKTRFVEFGKDLLVVRLPGFQNNYSQSSELFEKAKGHKSLVLDLRGNGGGSEDGLLRMLGYLFDHPVKIGHRVSRKGTKDLTVKPRGPYFNGNLVVITDGDSGSASEIFARVIQLEKRGTVVGDRTSGKVMESAVVPLLQGEQTMMFFGVQVTVSDLIMSDGKSLEHNPVLPDEEVLPSQADILSNRDPVLVRATQFTGMSQLTPETAGLLFPYQWKRL